MAAHCYTPVLPCSFFVANHVDPQNPVLRKDVDRHHFLTLHHGSSSIVYTIRELPFVAGSVAWESIALHLPNRNEMAVQDLDSYQGLVLHSTNQSIVVRVPPMVPIAFPSSVVSY